MIARALRTVRDVLSSDLHEGQCYKPSGALCPEHEALAALDMIETELEEWRKGRRLLVAALQDARCKHEHDHPTRPFAWVDCLEAGCKRISSCSRCAALAEVDR